MSIIFAISVLPPLYLLWKVYQADEIEKEPAGLLIRIFALGALSTIPASFLEMAGSSVCSMLIPQGGRLFNLVFFFIVVGGAEELVKFLAMRIATWRSPEFNYVFDGVVYGVTASLGFAALENILYVMEGGLVTAGVRAFTSIPLHCITGIFMGHYYGIATSADLLGQPQIRNRMLGRAILIPLVIHGAYDFIASDGSELLLIVFLAYILLMDYVALRALNQYSKNDLRMF